MSRPKWLDVSRTCRGCGEVIRADDKAHPNGRWHRECVPPRPGPFIGALVRDMEGDPARIVYRSGAEYQREWDREFAPSGSRNR